MGKMNKKGELITLSIIVLLILIGGIIYFQEKTKNGSYVIVDLSTKIVYNPESDNPNCNINNLTLDTDNLKLFDTMNEAKSKGFIPHKFCN